MKLLVPIALAFGLCTPFYAQGVIGGFVSAPGPAGPAGTVAGRVFLDDTKTPARFARVFLQAPPAETGEPLRSPAGTFNGITGADGTFTIGGVAPGDYWVQASAAGYLGTGTEALAEVRGGVPVADIVHRLTRVHVAADGTSTANLTLQRGAVLAGRVEWEDGTPAAGLNLSARSTAPNTRLPDELRGLNAFDQRSANTDERGMFRISGLPEGEYIVQFSLQLAAMQVHGRNAYLGVGIQVYAPGKFRRSEAQTYTLTRAEVREDLRVVVDFTRLRTVSGHVSAPAGADFSGGMRLILSDAAGPPGTVAANTRDTLIDDHGDFTFRYIPAGDYTLSVAPFRGENGTRGNWQIAPATLHIGDGDTTGLALTLTPLSTK